MSAPARVRPVNILARPSIASQTECPSFFFLFQTTSIAFAVHQLIKRRPLDTLPALCATVTGTDSGSGEWAGLGSTATATRCHCGGPPNGANTAVGMLGAQCGSSSHPTRPQRVQLGIRWQTIDEHRNGPREVSVSDDAKESPRIPSGILPVKRTAAWLEMSSTASQSLNSPTYDERDYLHTPKIGCTYTALSVVLRLRVFKAISLFYTELPRLCLPGRTRVHGGSEKDASTQRQLRGRDPRLSAAQPRDDPSSLQLHILSHHLAWLFGCVEL